MITGSFYFLYWWILLTPILFFGIYTIYKRPSLQFKLSPISWFENIPTSSTQKIGKALRWIIFVLLISFISIGASGPVREIIPDEDKARNVFLVIDTSLSMREKDFYDGLSALTRMEGIKKVVKSFIKQRTGDRIGIVVFGGRSFLLSPLTKDISFLEQSIDALQPGIGGDGTAIGDGLSVALQRLEKVNQDAKAIILVTDGASNAGTVQPVIASKIAANLNVKIHSIGIGDANQESYDEATLKTISNTTNGVFRNASDVSALMDVTKEIDLLIESLSPNISNKALIHYSRYFAIIGAILFVVYIIINFKLFHRFGTGLTLKKVSAPIYLLTALLLIAIYSPKIGKETSFTANSSSYATVFAVDLSASMNAADISPTRLEKIKRDIKKVIKKSFITNQKIALIGFAGAAQVMAPPTDDYDTILRLVESLNTQLIADPGTNLPEAISVSGSLITNGQGQIILITDGETDQKDDALFIAKSSSVPISTLAVGTDSGGSIGGANINVKVDKQLLSEIANLSNGKVLNSLTIDQPTKSTASSSQVFRIQNEIGWIFLALSLFVIFICQYFFRLPLFLPSLFFILFNLPKSAIADDISSYQAMKHYQNQQYDQALDNLKDKSNKTSDWKDMSRLGATNFKLQKFKEASEFYSHSLEAAKDTSEKFDSHYNLGNSFLAQDSFDEAITQYRNALDINPDSIEAKTNLEIALKRKEQQQNKQNSGQDKQQNKKDDQEDNNSKDQNKSNDSKDKPSESENQSKEDPNKKQAKEWLNALPEAPVIIRQGEQENAPSRGKQWW